MAVYVLGDIVDAIETTLSAAASLRRSQSYDELTEGVQRGDAPLLQVYPEENPGTSGHSETDRISFSGAHSVKRYVIFADLYAKQRSNIGEDMKQLVDTINELEDILDSQTYPVFGSDYILSFRWLWGRVVFDYAGVNFMGARFQILVEVGTGG